MALCLVSRGREEREGKLVGTNVVVLDESKGACVGNGGACEMRVKEGCFLSRLESALESLSYDHCRLGVVLFTTS